MPKYVFQDIDDGPEEATEVRLADDFELEIDGTQGGFWTAKLWMMRRTRYEDWVRLRERPGASILYSDPIEKRKSTETKFRVEAVRFAERRLHARHVATRMEGDPTGKHGVASAGERLPIGLVPDLLRRHDALRPPEISPPEKRRILKACDVVIAALGAGKDAQRLSQDDVHWIYARTTGCKMSGAELSDEELRAMGLTAADLGVTLRGRPRRSKFVLRTRPSVVGLVSLSTTHNDIMAFSAALTRLVGKTDGQGKEYLSHNRLLQLNVGHGPGEQTQLVSKERARYMIKYADAATAEWNRVKRENEPYIRRGSRSADGTLRQVPIGAVRCLYSVAWHRAVRHDQILGLNVEDNLSSTRAVREAIRRSRPSPGQESAKPEWASTWSKHGCLFFAIESRQNSCGVDLKSISREAETRKPPLREIVAQNGSRRPAWAGGSSVTPNYSADSLMEYAQKPGFDRVCPNGPQLRKELDRYITLRGDQGLPNAGPLFRYIDHDRRLDPPVVREIIAIAERLAREECRADGHDPDEVFCAGVRPLHDVRTTVANRWDRMGWDHNRNAAWLGCWSTNLKLGNAADADYKKFDPLLVQALAENLKRAEALELTGVADGAKSEAEMDVPD